MLLKKCSLLFLFSAVSIFVSATEWKGKVISFQTNQGKPNTWTLFRKYLKINTPPDVLNAKIATDTKYWLWINEQLVVFEGGLKRGPARNASYYDEIDIAPYLTTGDNTIAVLTWYFGKNGFSHISSGRTGLWFEAIGQGLEIVSDTSWRGDTYRAFQDTGEPQPNYRLSESNIRYDAREEIKDWNKKVFNGKLYQPSYCSFVEDTPWGELVKRPIPQWKDYGMKAYENTKKSGDTLICKLPYNCQFTPYFRVKAKAGDTIYIKTDDFMAGKSPNIRAEYITRDGEQEYENLGWMNGHEVYYIIPNGVEVLDVKYHETGYNAEFVRPFHCNDDFYNELWKRSARTLYITMRDNYMDCPDRERAQWWGDEVNELGETFYALTPSAQELALKGIHELMNWQRSDGVIFAPCPAGNWNRELPSQMLASVGWYGFYTQYFYSGDSSFVPIIYDRLHRYLHDVWKTDDAGLVMLRRGDWFWGDWGDNIDQELLQNCWYYLALKSEKEFALMLNKTSDVNEITAMMQRIEQNFDKRFWTGKEFRTPTYDEETDDRAQALAIVSGLASKDKYKVLSKVLMTENHASPYMEKYVLEALFLMEQPELALQRMKERYSSMLCYENVTTLFEEWDKTVAVKSVGKRTKLPATGPNQGTYNHAWSGGPLTLLSQKVCGIEPTSPGFRTFRIRPQLGNLKEASASVVSASGEINVKVVKSGSKQKITADIPQGTTAEIVFPSGKTLLLKSGRQTVDGK